MSTFYVLALLILAADAGTVLTSLKVNSMAEPLSLDDKQPVFSWQVDADGERGVVTDGYELVVSALHANGTTAPLWGAGPVKSNQTQFIPYPADGPALLSNSDYVWKVRASGPTTDWAESTFSTGLFLQSDWGKAVWVQKSNASAFASQMRKEFKLPTGTITRARAFVALPGYGHVWVNGHKVDGRAGTRTLSQYDVRALYHTYDVAQ
jgi:alpha-L-rhamnosidase